MQVCRAYISDLIVAIHVTQFKQIQSFVVSIMNVCLYRAISRDVLQCESIEAFYIIVLQHHYAVQIACCNYSHIRNIF